MDMTVAVERDVPAAMRDGTLLRADVYRPVGVGESLPALVARTPYNKAGMEEVCRTMAARGYIAIVQDIRGRYASDGEWRPMYDDTNLEPTDGYGHGGMGGTAAGLYRGRWHVRRLLRRADPVAPGADATAAFTGDVCLRLSALRV